MLNGNFNVSFSFSCEICRFPFISQHIALNDKTIASIMSSIFALSDLQYFAKSLISFNDILMYDLMIFIRYSIPINVFLEWFKGPLFNNSKQSSGWDSLIFF